MIVTGSVKKVRDIIRTKRNNGKVIGLVPTMGALHDGHLSLIKKARKDCDFLAVSIFVNPTQFGVGEDYSRYPRSIAEDKRLLKYHGIDLLFFPKVSTIYPGQKVSVYAYEDDLSKVLCGRSRPDHFKGVCTVLVKLFNIVTPAVAYFGQKDYQQALIVKRMVKEFHFPTAIRIMPIVRDPDGLAMSSRNAYLTGRARENSRCLYRALDSAVKYIKSGERNPKIIINRMKRLVKSKELAKIDYIEIVDAENLKKVDIIKGKILIALAVYIGKVRLIDNTILDVKK